MPRYARRSVLAGAATFALGGLALGKVGPIRGAFAHHLGRELVIGTRVIEVKGKAAKVFGLIELQAGHTAGGRGLFMTAGERLQLRLRNECGEAALLHWHGLTPPNAQDGVPGVTQPILRPGESHDYDFPVALPGTNWMHSHHSLQEQRLMAAPLIVRDPKDAGRDEQDVVIMLHDFTFRDPDEILAALAKGMSHDHAAMGHGMAQMPLPADAAENAPPPPPMMGGMDLNDVAYDAFLVNDRTLDDPEVVRVQPAQRVRLRIVNGAAATNFIIDLGALTGILSDVDGRPIRPVTGKSFPLAIAQRADIRLSLPAGEGAWPILFQREGDTALTGLVLATKGGAIVRIAEQAAAPIGAIDRSLPMFYEAAEPLAQRAADRRLQVLLTGAMMSYQWGIADPASPEPKVAVRRGERVELELINRTDMSHPIHLHGHHFQIVAVNGKRVAGAMRDTELVPIGGRVTIALDADNPGRWMFHCHNLYHMLSGMMTEVAYL